MLDSKHSFHRVDSFVAKTFSAVSVNKVVAALSGISLKRIFRLCGHCNSFSELIDSVLFRHLVFLPSFSQVYVREANTNKWSITPAFQF